MLFGYVLFETVALVFLILAFSIPPFATQNLSSQCNVVKKSDGSPVSMLYYHLFGGLSSSPKSCSNSGSDFCVGWSNYAAWNSFDALADSINPNYFGSSDISKNWESSQVRLLRLLFYID